MPENRMLKTVAAMVLVGLALSAQDGPAPEAERFLPLGGPVLPRYRLEVGQELVYLTQGGPVEDSVIRLLVGDESPDGGWSVAVIAAAGARFRAELPPDGRVARGLPGFLPPLPADAEEAVGGWTAADPAAEYRLAGIDPRDECLLAISETRAGGISATVLFDTALGLAVYREELAGGRVAATMLEEVRYLGPEELDSTWQRLATAGEGE
ncbi:MAG: hypothetical protein R6X12_00460 [bacterium]